MHIGRIRFVLPLILTLAASSGVRAEAPQRAAGQSATLWMQTAAEYQASARQAYSFASERLATALATPRWTAALEQQGSYEALPPAVILDIDETALDNSPFQASLIRAVSTACAEEKYYPKAWDRWVALKQAKAVPGAPELVWNARKLGIEVFYVTNRACTPRADGAACPQEDETIENLALAGFPPTDREHLLLKHEQPDWESEKSGRRAIIAKTHRILMLVGDDLGDFLPGAKSMPLAERQAQVEGARDWWGVRWFMLPNPTYGSWQQVLGNAPLEALRPVAEIVDAIAVESKEGPGMR